MHYWKFVYTELLCGIAEVEEIKCNCNQCQTELNEYKTTLIR